SACTPPRALTALSAWFMSRVSAPGPRSGWAIESGTTRVLSASGSAARMVGGAPTNPSASTARATARRRIKFGRIPVGSGSAVERLDGAPGRAAGRHGRAVGRSPALPDHPVAAALDGPADEDLLVGGTTDAADEQGIEHHAGGGKATVRARNRV